MWLPGKKIVGGEVVDTFNDLAETRVMDSLRPNDGCSCDTEEGGRHVGDGRLGGDHDRKKTRVGQV